MAHRSHLNLLSLHLFLLTFISIAYSEETKVMNVGKELIGEAIPLKLGQSIYKIIGLKESIWYEVKISYPASMPASFSIELKKDQSEQFVNKNRRLLNTEKLIFKADRSELVYVLVTVEPEGVVAQPGVKERELVLFNIVCDELILGIPGFAWWVGLSAFLCLLFALAFPFIFSLDKLLGYNCSKTKHDDSSKIS